MRYIKTHIQQQLNRFSEGCHISESISGNESKTTQQSLYFNKVDIEISLCRSGRMIINWIFLKGLAADDTQQGKAAPVFGNFNSPLDLMPVYRRIKKILTL